MRLRNKIGAAMAAVTLAGVAVTGLLTWVRIDRTIHEESEREIVDATARLSDDWRSLGTDVAGQLSRVVEERSLRTSLDRLTRGVISSGSIEMTGVAPRLMDGLELSYLQVFDRERRALSTDRYRIRNGREDPEGWSIVGRNTPGAVVHQRTVRGTREWAIETSKTMEVNNQEFHVVGGQRITPEMVENLTRRAGGIGYLQMRDSTRIVPGGVVPGDLDHLVDARQQVINGRSFIVGSPANGEPAKICLVPIPGAGGTVIGDVVLQLSQARLAGLASELSWAFLGVAAIGLVLAWAIGFWIARRITRPVEQLAVAARRVGVGRAPGAMPTATDDEVGDLIRSFRRMTDDLAESRRELVRAERLAAWRDIAQRMAHEIKNALSPIQISVETIQRTHQAGHPDMASIVDESVETVRTEVRGLRNLVNEFSQFARMPDLELTAGSVNLPVERAANLHDRNTRDVRVETMLSDGLPDVGLDADALARAVGNLILNAVEATPASGRVRVTTAKAESGGVDILVDDQGGGIAPENRERIFEPYFTTKPGGTGLGLAMVWKIVSEHAGRVEIHDAPGGGARFRIVLPPREDSTAIPTTPDREATRSTDGPVLDSGGNPTTAGAGGLR